jgi:hypothetical protein
MSGPIPRGGTLDADVDITDRASDERAGSCRTGTVRWAATRDPGRVYGGATSQEEPIVLRLDRRRRTITDVLVGWQTSTCEPPENFMRFGERFGAFRLRSQRFGDAFTDSVSHVGREDRLRLRVDRIDRARGRLHVTVTGTDAAGSRTLACDTGDVPWRARTG